MVGVWDRVRGRVARRRRTVLTNMWFLEGVNGSLCVGGRFGWEVLWDQCCDFAGGAVGLI